MERRKILTDVFASRLSESLLTKNETVHTLAEALSLSPSTISRYQNGLMNPKITTLYAMASYLNVNPVWLMGYDGNENETAANVPYLAAANLYPASRKKVPLLGNIAAGEPIFADENHSGYMCAEEDIDADFCLIVKGDSMINARIFNGDVVFIHAQPDVEDGEIAAVLIDDEATLKRVYKMEDRIILRPENPTYKPMEFKKSDGKNIRILGKAIAFQGKIQ